MHPEHIATGLTRGFGVTLARDCPSYGLYFATYHWAVQGFNYILQSAQAAATTAESAAHALSAGATAGALALAESSSPQLGRQQQLGDDWNGDGIDCWQDGCQSIQQQQQGVELQQQGVEQHQQGVELQQHGLEPQAQQRAQPQQVEGHNVSEMFVQFLAGGVAGALAWASIYPIDVVKSRIQVGSRLAFETMLYSLLCFLFVCCQTESS